MRAFRGLLLSDGRPAIRRNHQIQKNMQICRHTRHLNAARQDALLEATILAQTTELFRRTIRSVIKPDPDEIMPFCTRYDLKRLKSEGVSGAALRTLKTIHRAPQELDSKYFARVNKRLETKLLVLGIIAADMNENFLSEASKLTKPDIEEESNRSLLKLDLSPDLWTWFHISVGLPLYKTDDEGLIMRLKGPAFEGVSNMELEFKLGLALAKANLGTNAVKHIIETCPKCQLEPFKGDSLIGHVLNLSYDFAYKLERQTNFKWSDEPANHLGPYLRRLPYLDEHKNQISFDLIFERSTNR